MFSSYDRRNRHKDIPNFSSPRIVSCVAATGVTLAVVYDRRGSRSSTWFGGHRPPLQFNPSHSCLTACPIRTTVPAKTVATTQTPELKAHEPWDSINTDVSSLGNTEVRRAT